MFFEDLNVSYVVFGIVTVVAAAALFVVKDLAFTTVNGESAQLLRLPEPQAEPRTPIGRFDRWFDNLISQTGYGMSSLAAFFAMIASCLLVGGGIFVWREDILLGTIGFLTGVLITLFLFLLAKNQRQQQILQQIPEIMDFMARAVRAGESIEQVFQIVADTHRDPLAVEFRRCSRQLAMGLSMDATMRGFVRRVPLTEVRIFSAVLTVQRKTGGNLSQTMERLARVFRERLTYRRQYRAATASGRMSTAIISAAGLVVIGYLTIWRPEYLQQFVSSTVGQILLGIAILLYVAGLVWVARLMRLEF